MKRSALLSVLFAACLFMAGCANGLLLNNGIFTHTVQPLTFNREPTKVKEIERESIGRITQVTAPYLNIRLGKNGLGDIARENGIETIYYADIEQWTAAFGTWRMDVVHIYGR